MTSARKAISVDTETNYTDAYGDRFCVGISICLDGEDTYYLPVGHLDFHEWKPENVILPVDFFDGVTVPIIFHNAKFDIHVLRNLGLKFPREHHDIQDTMLMAHLIDEEKGVGLDELSKRYLGNEGKRHELKNVLKKLGGNEAWPTFPPMYMADYAETDAKLTYDLYFYLLPKMEHVTEVYQKKLQFMLLLQKIEEAGSRVDEELCRSLKKQCEDRMLQLRRELGFDPAKSSQLHPRLFSMPPHGLGLTPSSFTPTGKPQVNDDFLSSVNHPMAGLVLEYRGLGKAKSTYFGAYLELADLAGRLHPSFNITGTITGRLSCTDPNLQQIPRDSDVKQVFLPEPGYELWEFDYSNMEYRLAVAYSGDTELIQRLNNREDFHTIVANRLGISRQLAKVVNFLLIYGGGAKALSAQLGISEKEAWVIINAYRKEFAKIFTVMREATAVAERKGFVKTWTGRRRHFMEYPNYHKAFNSIIQGGAAEVLEKSSMDLHAAGFLPVNLIHDAVWLNLKDKSEVEKVQPIMEDWTEEVFGVRFFTDAKRLRECYDTLPSTV